MPTPQLPIEKAIVTGAAAVNPARFKDRVKPKLEPVGNPPGWLAKHEAECWWLFVDEIPWLSRADRPILEVATRLRARMMYDTPTIQVLNLLRQCLGQLGATPADRGKVTHWDAPEVEPTDEHFQS